MKKVLITSSDTYADGVTASYDVTSLTAGALAVFDPAITGGVDLVDAGGANIVGGELIFAVGNAETDVFISPLVNKESLSYYKQIYVAPVAKVMTFGKSGAIITWPSLVAGHVYGFKIIDLDKPVEDTSRVHSVDYVLTAADAADDDVATASIVSAINADTEIYKILTASAYNTDDGFVFTGKAYTGSTKQHNFTVIETGKFVDNPVASIDTTTALKTGFGCPWQVAEEYKMAMTEHGQNQHYSGSQEGLWSLTSVVVSSATYTGYALTWKAHKSARRQQIDVEGNFHQDLMIYVPSANAALIAALDAILAAFTA